MWQFFKNEGQAFLNDMQALGEFFMQPVTFGKKNENLMLRPTMEEIEVKAEIETQTETQGFWKKEWNLFLNDMQTLGEIFIDPRK